MANINDKAKMVWEKAPKCKCGKVGCLPQNHRLCTICNKKMLFGSYYGEETQRNSKYAWDIDHIKPKSRGGTDNIDNLRAVHVDCNRLKGDK